MTTDVILDESKGYYDIVWTASGDIDTAATLDTAILMSIFEEARANEGEIPQSHLRRGWIGNELTPDFEQGNKVWLLSQERLTGTILAEIGPLVKTGLQWMIDEGIATNVEVGSATYKNGSVYVPITIYRPGSEPESLLYELWNNTGVR